ncbi:DDE family transposase [Paraburkholderia sp. BL25I1N1]|nr:DDE family transposase [Paraburkholderia sp. BL25I1N1]
MVFGGVFSGLRDRRGARGTRYEMEPLLCAALVSQFAGATSLRKIEAFIDERLKPLNQLFGRCWPKARGWVGIRRFLLEIDEAEIESAVRVRAHGLMASSRPDCSSLGRTAKPAPPVPLPGISKEVIFCRFIRPR